MFAVELYAPGRDWPAVKGWWGRALVFNALQAAMVYISAVTWDRWLPGLTFWHTDETFGTEGGAVFGYLVITFIYYWWHRARHEVPLFWRIFHQVHHSARRIEVITSFYKHPAEIAVNGLLSSAILYCLCGLSPEAATAAVLLTGLAELFYHWNVRTPYWIGFLVQRPESHCIHHRHGWHRQNYSDLPLWDILFGTFHNPRRFEESCGFDPDLEEQVGAMLAGVDLHAARDEGGSS